ncbi:DUF6602 domain-containing protein [Micromonospora aurantiaca (nom. illeg.)]|uniref:DUF6602 domain-containing protein n=1 Tax=Micromonospora aurantiaca (nom. illeg.) TaxID=47850 RepID=UPI000828846A|nr:DUF6602 domain-containing protein [Micromonospora aurantiaca]SCL40121.1 hypothetical protein GA0070615_4289 [Micromonospora aurantiaca]
MSIVETYWSGVSRRLQEEVDTFNRLIGHAGEQGRENEQSLVSLMERLLPRSLGVGTGVVIDADGNRSKQSDIIIFDLNNQPTIMAQTNQMLFPVENTFMVIEVKTTLNDDEVEDCAQKKASLNKLNPRGTGLPSFCVVAYHAQAATAPITVKLLRAIEEEQRPDLLCVISGALLAGRPEILTGAGDSTYPAGIAALHRRSQDGTRLSNNWDTLVAGESGSFVLRDGVRHPVTRKGRSNADRLVAEPGRALLNFCSMMLTILAAKGAIPEPSLRHYLQDQAKELVAIPESN